MDRILRKALCALTLLFAGGFASAQDEHNPLDKLEKEDVCKPAMLEPGVALLTNNTSAQLKLPRDKVLTFAIGKNGLPPPESLDQTGTYIDLLADAMVPCGPAMGLKKPKPGASRKTILEYRQAACQADGQNYQKSEGDRYGSDAVRTIRQNLLRLFQSGSIGGTENLIVVRRITPRDDQHPWNADDERYRPLKSRAEDDLMILKYLYADDGSEPFQVFCKKREFKTGSNSIIVRFAEDELPQDLKQAYIADYAAPNAGGLWTKIVTATEEQKLGKVKKWSPSQDNVPLTRFEQSAINQVKNKSVGEALKWKGERKKTYQLVLAKGPQEFIKAERVGAEFGTSVPRSTDDDKLANSGDLELTADATLGLHFRWTDKVTGTTDREDKGPKYKGSQIWAITPYASINQTTQKLTFYEPPVFKAETKKFGYAKLASGLRLDYRSTLPPVPVKGTALSSALDIQKAGQDQVGIGTGIYLEYIGDNYNIVSARRIGGYFSPSANMFGPVLGAFYQRSFPLDALLSSRLNEPTKDKKSYTIGDDFLSGWFVKWDAVGVVEDLNYSRLPRNFGAIPDPDKPAYACWPLQCEDAVVSGAVYGTDLSISIERYNLLGLGKDDLFASFTAKLKSRREFQGGNSSDLWDFSLKLQDPTSDKSRYWQIKYLIGEDYVTNKEEDQLSFGLVFTN